jgi:hypothetical protein
VAHLEHASHAHHEPIQLEWLHRQIIKAGIYRTLLG